MRLVGKMGQTARWSLSPSKLRYLGTGVLPAIIPWVEVLRTQAQRSNNHKQSI